jgi:nucleoside-diphosphate-sugar epimerase
LISKQNLDLLREKLKPYRQIVVTGASGWLGGETIELFFDLFKDEFEERVIIVSSIPKDLRMQNKVFKSIGWDEFKSLRSIDLLIHFAYLNQDKAKVLGLSEFIDSNRTITSDVSTFLSCNPGCDLLFASSGAVKFYPANIDSNNPMEVYAGLKTESEHIYLQNKDLASVLNMRIWNVSGSRLKIDSPYALSNFFKQALETGKIELVGNGQSSRTYVDVKEMMLVFLLSLEKGKRITLDSGGYKVTFFDLATKILKELGLHQTSLILSGEYLTKFHYNPDTTIFNNKACEFELELSDISSQLNHLAKVFSTSYR